MDNGATKSKIHNMYKEMCSTGRQILTEFDMWNYANEKFYKKLLNKTDNSLIKENTYLKGAEVAKELKGKVLITSKVRVAIDKIGEIESVGIEYPEYNTKMYVIGKREYALSEIYFTKYIVENSKFENANKYILILTKNKEREKNIGNINGVKIKRINKSFLEKVKESVKRTEYVENKIMPEFERYLQLFDGNKVTPKNMNSEICGGFIQYLKNRKEYQDKD